MIDSSVRFYSPSTNARARGESERSVMLLVKLWIAKKLAVLLAVRAFGVKRLYRRGLKLSRYAFGDVEASENAYRRTTERVLWHTCHAAMITEQWLVRRATAFTEKVFTNAGFSARGMPSGGEAFGGTKATPKPPKTKTP